MSAKHFNLVTMPWIKVINQNNQEQKVSLNQLFQNAHHYRQLAGEMKSQDLAIMRFLLAILTTVYSRFDNNGQPYSWLNIEPKTMRPLTFDDDYFEDDDDEIQDDLLQTWHELYRSGSFSEIVNEYLQKNLHCFDFFNQDTPFYQVTKKQYDSLVPQNKSIEKGKGTVAVKQINRTISESNNKPDIFSPNSSLHKDDVSLDELVRWLIMYQNFTAVTDKTKVLSKSKFSVSRGWLYGLNPVFAVGHNFFETLMLNLILIPQQVEFSKEVIDQRPVWEWSVEKYINFRKDEVFPKNIAQLYTIWSRAMHIEWDNNIPVIFSAGLPKLNNEDAFLEPMTTWKFDKKSNTRKPNLRWMNSLGKAMWRNFGQYVSTNIDSHDNGFEPGIVAWLNLLKGHRLIKLNSSIHLMTVGLISDGNATSQSPAAEFADSMQIKADVLFDGSKQNYWPRRIEDVVKLTDKVGLYIWHFAKNTGELGGISDSGEFANQISARFFSELNYPFNEWLAGLTNKDERDEKVQTWEKIVYQLAKKTVQNLLRQATPRELKGEETENDGMSNIFVYYHLFNASLAKTLNVGRKKNDN